MSETWIPRSKREDATAAAEYSGPFEGVPDHLRGTLLRWVEHNFQWQLITVGDHSRAHDQIDFVERKLRRSFPGQQPRDRLKGLLKEAEKDGDLCLDLIDLLLASRVFQRGEVLALSQALEAGGSVWKVKFGLRESGLIRRTEPPFEEMLHEATGPTDNASMHLKAGWAAAFGRSPTATLAYTEAVRALEAALQPMVLATDRSATLGKIINAIRDKPSKFVARLEATEGAGVTSLCSQLENIWKSDVRHGSGIPGAPVSVSLDQARDAIVHAVCIVQIVRQQGFDRS